MNPSGPRPRLTWVDWVALIITLVMVGVIVLTLLGLGDARSGIRPD